MKTGDNWDYMANRNIWESMGNKAFIWKVDTMGKQGG